MRTIKASFGTYEIPDAPCVKMGDGKELKLPVFVPILVDARDVVANNYNPNHVDKQNMELLKRSIMDNGFTFAIVTIWDDEQECFVIVDGFHRFTILTEHLKCQQIPIVVLDQNNIERMSATIQFNRARGVHQIELMADLTKALFDQGADDEEIARRLGMDLEEVFRLKQVTGIAYLFRNQPYSKAWEMQEVSEDV